MSFWGSRLVLRMKKAGHVKGMPPSCTGPQNITQQSYSLSDKLALLPCTQGRGAGGEGFRGLKVR